jgi:choice-of-anchor A domain-containing protein
MSGDYSISASSGSIYVAAGARVRLYVTSNFGPSVIRVAGSGSGAGNLQIYMGGSSFTVSSQTMVDGGNAANLAYWGLPGNTSITFNGNASFVGTIYAPEADFTLGGGGSSTYDFCGSCVVKSITMNGHFSFHYDENLWRAGPARGYVATSWREL